MNDELLADAPLRAPAPTDAEMISGWHLSPEETQQWSSSERPVTAEQVVAWWAGDDVEPWVLADADGELVAYGELWLDEDEDEVELARLIVKPELRGHGLGKRLTRALMEKAATTGLATTMLRVVPDNAVAIGCYRACGFEQLGPEESAVWNQGQRREWTWMVLPADA